MRWYSVLTAVFTGIALLQYGSGPYLVGSMMNFLDHTNDTTGMVRGCLTPDGETMTEYHAKPIIIQVIVLFFLLS